MLLRDLVLTSREVSDTRSRLAKVAALSRALRALGPDEIAAGVAFLAGEVRQGRLGVGWATLAATLRDCPPAPGDGDRPLSLLEVDAAFDAVQAATGAGSARARAQRLGALLCRASAAEQQFLTALLQGGLRQGALEGVLLDAIAAATGAPAAAVRRAVMLTGSVAAVAAAALIEGPAALGRFSIEMFRALDPMLAQTADGLDEALSKLPRAALELKLDGARVQVHRSGDDVRVFSRQRNDVTASVPELVEVVRALPVRAAILDGEAIALRPGGGPQPFQVTMRRFGRRLDVDRMRAELPLGCFFFDCLAIDDQPLIDRPYAERMVALDAAVAAEHRVARHLPTGADDAAAFVQRALAAGHEGVMVKALDAPYEAGRRGAGWLKVKPVHTLDLVVLAVEWGSGRRSGWLSNLHLGARDPAGGGFVMLGKTFKGMTDEMLAWQTQRLAALALDPQAAARREAYVVPVRPELVVEISFDGVQASPHYPAGLALRFARVVRYRPDKAAADADTIDTVREIFARGHRDA